jgi:predicted Zn-dependent protease
MDDTSNNKTDDVSQASSPVPLIEIGWIVAGGLDEIDRQAIENAREETLNYLREKLPSFSWRIPMLRRKQLVAAARVAPVDLLDAGVVERNAGHWDFTVVITNADLISHYKRDAIAVVSRSMEGTVISTWRIDPVTTQPDIGDSARSETLAHRIMILVLHAFGHFCGLGHQIEKDNFMFDFETIEDVDNSLELSDRQIDALNSDLREVSDQRLEESTGKRKNSIGFYIKAAWINRSDILESLIEAKPWQFPYRLSRLTTAAVSAILILLISAEAWDLGMSQTPWFVVLLSLVAICFTTIYTLIRQKLFVRREHRKLSEQNVVTNVSTSAIVFFGIMTTYLIMLLLTITVALTLFSNRLADNWSESIVEPPNATHYFSLALFVASLGIFIGALGASFEEQTYFRHVTFVDEEI